jgi:hypothetical protein
MAGYKIISKSEKNVDEFPKVSKALLDVLHQMVPERCPDSNESDRDIWIYSGQRQIVRFLQAKFDEQQERGR